ncbi:MAG: DNA/RNA nuclease SfsA [Candidatus Competibacteraceae bacterium]|nr:DNA/RNA nuclease SfsA [Candidatus Competibacteraceae bacterium]
MEFAQPLIPAVLIRRYKRFLADVELTDGTCTTVHCPNTGAMLGCREPGSPVWLSRSANPKRRYPLTWEMVETPTGVRVGINTGLTNRLVEEAIGNGRLAELAGYANLRREVGYGSGSRVDFLLEGSLGSCHLEVKNVTAAVDSGLALFPDAVSARATRHLQELMAVVAAGGRGVLCFCVQRADATAVAPYDKLDPLYGHTLRQAVERGVEVLACGASVSPQAITVDRRLAVLL